MQLNKINLNLLLRVIVAAALCLLLSGCSSINWPAADKMIANLNNTYPALWKLATATAYLFGVGFMMSGVYHLKQYGMGISMTSQQNSIKGPLIYLMVGAALMFFPTLKEAMLDSTFGYGQQSVIRYDIGSSLVEMQAMHSVLGLVQLVGVVAFIRGWIMVSNTAQASGQHSQFGKALTHIFGGLLAINIQGTIDIFGATLGIST